MVSFYILGKMGKCMDEGDSILKMEISMKAILKMDKERAKEFILGLTTPFIKVNLSNKRIVEKRFFKWVRNILRFQRFIN
jgi:hypothetical protein